MIAPRIDFLPGWVLGVLLAVWLFVALRLVYAAANFPGDETPRRRYGRGRTAGLRRCLTGAPRARWRATNAEAQAPEKED